MVGNLALAKDSIIDVCVLFWGFFSSPRCPSISNGTIPLCSSDFFIRYSNDKLSRPFNVIRPLAATFGQIRWTAHVLDDLECDGRNQMPTKRVQADEI